MSDHEFEKQVQQKLGELKLHPSDTVWMEVQKNIRRDKRRRRFFWLWTPMLFICLSTSAYILYRFNNSTQPTTNNITAPLSTINTPVSEKQQTNTAKATSEINTINSNRVEPAATTPTLAQKITPKATVQNTTAVAVAKDKQVTESKPATTKKGAPATSVPVTIHQPEASASGYIIADNTPVMAWHKSNRLTKSKYGLVRKQKTGYTNLLAGEPMQQHGEFGQIATIGSMPDFAKIDYKIATDNAATNSLYSKILHPVLPDSLGNTTAAILPIQRNRPVLWHWGVETDAGLSRIAQSKLFQLKGWLGDDKYAAEDLSARVNSTPNSGSFLNVSPTVVKPAAPIQPDFAFAAGVFVERALSKRFRLSVGLRYEYMSMYTQVGPKVVTNTPVVVNLGTSKAKLVTEYYKSAGTYEKSSLSSYALSAQSLTSTVNDRYKYRFQYLELPVMAHWQVNKGLRLPPLVFDGGFSISHLMSVDALHYEGVKGIYYKDNDLFNTTQANIIMGFSVGLLQHTKHPMWVGPDLRYSLTGLVNKQVSTGQYMWSTGISVKILLGRL